MEKILIIEDDIIIGGGIKLFLEKKGFEAFTAESIKEAEEMVGSAKFELIILDINLPDGNGLDFCRQIRKKHDIPVIFLTANDTEENMIEGFRCGCDDYISKPFSVEILYHRISAVLRRTFAEPEKSIFEYRKLCVDFSKMQVISDGNPVKLSSTEYRLLELLIKNRGQVLTRNSILEKIWDCDENFIDENTLNVHIRRLRQKIEKDPGEPEYILTVFGIGYTFGE